MVLPLVTCMMPTCNRRTFVPQAIRYFLQQDYENKELLIVDDGDDCIEDLIPVSNQIRYIRSEKNKTLGEKRNFCVRESQGNLIMHWDDDDWMAPYRISYQVSELLKHKAEVCGLQQMLYYEMDTGACWLYQYPPNAQPWLAGNSLLYTRDFWEKRLFPDMQVASDTKFIYSHRLESYVALADYHFYVATAHRNNTSTKHTNSKLWHAISPVTIQNVVGPDWPLYAGNGKGDKQTTNIQGNGKQDEPVFKNAVSACLLSYKRPGNIQKIVDNIHQYNFIDEILIWNNNTEHELNIKGYKVRVINTIENSICYGRFLCAREAKNEIIYFQDDDALVHNVATLYQAFLNDNSCITYALSPLHFKVKEKYVYSSGQVAFLGWGSFIQKSWITVLDKYLEHNTSADDFLFRREADKFFTLLLGKQNNTLPAQIELLQYDSTRGISLYLEKEHTLYVALAIRKALEFNRKQLIHQFPVTWNIVIACKNYGCYLRDAVNSVLYNHADYIITIVDDGSTDNTPDISLQLTQKYSFIKYIRNEESKGTGFARNQGIASVESLFVVLLDADDKIGGEYLFEAEKLLKKGYDVVNPDAILFGDISSRWPVPETVSLPMQLQRNHVHCCSAFRRSYWAQVGGIDEQMQSWEDYEFWIRLTAAGARIKKISGDHFFYRKHGPSRSSGSDVHNETMKNYIRKKHKLLFG